MVNLIKRTLKRILPPSLIKRIKALLAVIKWFANLPAIFINKSLSGQVPLSGGKLLIDRRFLKGGSILFSKKWEIDESLSGPIIVLDLKSGGIADVIWRNRRLQTVRLTRQTVKNLADRYHLTSIMVNQLAFLELPEISVIFESIKSAGRPYSYMIHDYFCLCPSVTLLHNDLVYRTPHCESNPACSFGSVIPKWREIFHEFMSGASELIVPSRTAAEIVWKIYPDLKFTVKPHAPVTILPRVFRGDVLNREELIIGVIGNINSAKGLNVIFDLARNIRESRLPVKIEILGEIQTRVADDLGGVLHSLGQYQPGRLAQIVREKNIAMVLFPSIWPETFSYVCDEILQMGLPLITFDLGAQLERIGDGRYGFITPVSEDAAGLMKILKQLVLDRKPILEKSLEIEKGRLDRPDVVVPVYNGLSHVKKCLQSVFENTDRPCRLIVIDDKSPDPEIKIFLNTLQSLNPLVEFKVVFNEKNLGFARTANLGLQMGERHTVILNSDTIVPKSWLSRLVQPVEQDPDIASVTPYSNAASMFSLPSAGNHDLPAGATVGKIDEILSNTFGTGDAFQIPTGVGFCMLMNRNTINSIGYFDSETFGHGYGEENDWCLRAVRAGWKNVLAQNLFVYHFNSGSFGEKAKELAEKNGKIIDKKYPLYRFSLYRFRKKDPCRNARKVYIQHFQSPIK